jgi:hypothetical protein
MKCNFIIKIIFVFTLFFFLIFLFGSEDEYKPSYLKSSFVEVRNNYFPEEPTNGMQSTVQRGIALQRQSNKKTDKYYNFYLQQENVTLSMNYNSSEGNLDELMVTRQGGSLKGKVNINTSGKSDGYQNWVKSLSVTKPVSRALGAQSGMVGDLWFDCEYDIRDFLLLSKTDSSKDVLAIYHAGQFRSFLPKFVSISETGEIITRRSYWDRLLRELYSTVIKPR